MVLFRSTDSPEDQRVYCFDARCNISMTRIAALFGLGCMLVHGIVYVCMSQRAMHTACGVILYAILKSNAVGMPMYPSWTIDTYFKLSHKDSTICK